MKYALRGLGRFVLTLSAIVGLVLLVNMLIGPGTLGVYISVKAGMAYLSRWEILTVCLLISGAGLGILELANRVERKEI